MGTVTEHFDDDRPVQCPLVLRLDPMHARTPAPWTMGQISAAVTIALCLTGALALGTEHLWGPYLGW